MKKILIAAVVLSFFCSCTVCSAKTFDMPYFQLNLPDHFTTIMPPAELIGGSGERFTYLFVEKDKERSKSVFIIVMGGKVRDEELAYRERALTAATNAFRKSLMESPKCESELSGTIITRIGNSDALYFEKTNRNCMILTERYWTAMGSEFFIAFSIYRIADADGRIYDQCIEAIRNVVLK